MLNRSKDVIDVNSLFHAPGSARGSTQVGSRFDDQVILSGPAFNTHHAAPDRFQIETFVPVYWTSTALTGT
jgi:hypothetical protein